MPDPEKVREEDVDLHYVEHVEDLVAENTMTALLFSDPANDRIGVRAPDAFAGGVYYISLAKLRKFLEAK